MSQRELLLVLSHAHGCSACRERLLSDPTPLLRSRPLTEAEKSTLTRLKFEDFITPELLAHASGCTMAELDRYRDEPVVRLRHL